ncbi:MAG: LacI family DNA-binding transcriptional regulator [Granulosicoccus sp.]
MEIATQKKGTLKGLAAELGLSITTVSRALGGYSDVAEATRTRVLAAAEAADYVPNVAGKMLVSGRSGFVGFLLPLRDSPIFDPFLGEYIAGLSTGLAERGRDLFMTTVSGTQTELTVLQHIVESGRADAMVLTRIAEEDERVDYLVKRGFPFVAHGRTINHGGYSWIDSDGKQAFSDLFAWLYELGHRRIGLMSITEAMTFRHYREEGLRTAIQDCGDDDVTLVTQHVPRFDTDSWESAIRTLLCADDRPTAIVALTDELALSVLDHAGALGIDVPASLTVIGFDNIPAAHYSTPGLTTFDQSIRTTAQQMAGLVLDELDSPHGVQQQLVPPTLIRRGSHGPAPVSIQ